ncbi:MAG: ROK family protein [Candidatus Neomarinimicrobiota bacterium]|nr:ROK family protein [Candidatus Neomarinimicrobiota bacterium]RKY50925.1 MAG: ROK family protein [Candidatus Neomarinimicrobiota bacterium]RKY54635.1 MAG: ROK family protein [Candidatus Neomarinimicrobiota bacterium]
MNILAIDIGGTKISIGIINQHQNILFREKINIKEKRGDQVIEEIAHSIRKIRELNIDGVGISIPGIYYPNTGFVWVPNIEGWINYPLKPKILDILGNNELKIAIDSDRTCSILGEAWAGKAKNYKNAIFISVGTGIGAGIMVDGKILRGQSNVAGAIGWMALSRPFRDIYKNYGCFEYYASGDGISRYAIELLNSSPDYKGPLREKEKITSYDIFEALIYNDEIATKVIENCIQLWGMACANLISIFNPEIIIFGGGIFGPASKYIDKIKNEAAKWAQPISMREVKIEVSELGSFAGLLGAAKLAIDNIHKNG